MQDRFSIDWLVMQAQRRMSKELFQRFMEDRREHHAPKWHVYGVLGHAKAVVEAAKLLNHLLGVDVEAEAVLHDFGKLKQFRKALEHFDRSEDMSTCYAGHEAISAGQAKSLGFPVDSVSAIQWHMLAYQNVKETKICSRLVNRHAALKWMVLCTADAVGKGFTEAQLDQRRNTIPGRFQRIGQQFGISPRLTAVCCEAVQSWEPATL